MSIRLSEAQEFTRTLDVVGIHNDDTEMILRANQTTLLGRGDQDYILSLRNTMLENTTFGGYRIPEDFDQEWNFKLGPIWAPDSVSISTLGCWLKPENFVIDSGGAAYTSATDASSNSVDFIQGTEGVMPDIGAKGLNNYKPLDYSDASGTHLFASAGDGNAIFNVGTSDEFLYAFVVNTGTDTGGYSTFICHGNITDNGHFACAQRTNSANRDIYLWTKSGLSSNRTQWDDVFTIGANHIIVFGKIGGAVVLRVDGTAQTASTSQTFNAVSSTDDTTLGMSFTGSGGDADREYDGLIYEMVFSKLSGGASSILPDVKKVEGYLAHKYLLTGSLPSDHDYKIDPPRASVTTS